VLVHHMRGINELAVHAPGKCSLAQTWADRGRDLVHRDRLIESALTAVRQGHYRHVSHSSLSNRRRRTFLPAKATPFAGPKRAPTRILAKAAQPAFAPSKLVGASGIEPPTTT